MFYIYTIILLILFLETTVIIEKKMCLQQEKIKCFIFRQYCCFQFTKVVDYKGLYQISNSSNHIFLFLLFQQTYGLYFEDIGKTTLSRQFQILVNIIRHNEIIASEVHLNVHSQRVSVDNKKIIIITENGLSR